MFVLLNTTYKNSVSPFHISHKTTSRNATRDFILVRSCNASLRDQQQHNTVKYYTMLCIERGFMVVFVFMPSLLFDRKSWTLREPDSVMGPAKLSPFCKQLDFSAVEWALMGVLQAFFQTSDTGETWRTVRCKVFRIEKDKILTPNYYI